MRIAMSKPFLLTLLCFSLSFLSTLAGGVYENLNYGDSQETVTKKLMECPRIENTVPETMFGRVGLNGTFKLKNTLNGLSFSLYFDWDDKGALKEVTLRSEPIKAAEYNSRLQSHFKATAQLMSQIYGKPVMSNAQPPRQQVEEGSIINSHLWHPPEGSLLLGIANTKGEYHVSIRYTSTRIEPVAQ